MTVATNPTIPGLNDDTDDRPEIRLADYDVIVVNTSAGKDSQAMLDLLVERADAEGVRDRLVAVHADLGRVEWAGTSELAATQAAAYGVRFEIIARPQGDLLDHIEQRHETLRAKGDTTTPAWPSSTARYCTSDHKRGQVSKVITALTREKAEELDRPVRILNCLGFRAEESPARAKRPYFTTDARLTNTKRHVDTWLPILDWTETEVWTRIRASGVPYHRAYDLGMPRLSCVLCIFAPKEALTIAAIHNRELARAYADLEAKVGHTFRQNLAIADVVAEAEELVALGAEADELASSLAERAGEWCM